LTNIIGGIIISGNKACSPNLTEAGRIE